jgi:hypothetical protein
VAPKRRASSSVFRRMSTTTIRDAQAIQPRTRSLILDSSHFVWDDQADAYSATIVDWIDARYRSAQ